MKKSWVLLMSAITSEALSLAHSTIPRRGAFILFEGVDRCGKTTQCSLLTSYLASKSSTNAIRFPDRTSVIGQLINSYLTSATNMNDQTIHLLFSANRWEASDGLEEKLRSGTNLVCDRYAYSGVAFTSAKGIDLNWCKQCDSGLVAPDAVIYLDIPVLDAAQRGSFGEERYEKTEFQIKVREKFMILRDEDEKVVPWYFLDARKSIEELHEEIKGIADSIVEKVAAAPLSRLWV